MYQFSQRLIAIGIGLLVLGSVPSAEILEQVLVKVNGEIFTKTELEARQVASLRALGQQADSVSKLSDPQLRRLLDEITPQLIVTIVDEMLLAQRGKELGYSLSDEQYKSIVDNIKKENKIDTDEAFEAALKAEGVTLTEFRKSLERQALMSRAQREVLEKLTVSDDELRRYYDEHVKDFTTSPTVTLREILIMAPAAVEGNPANQALATAAKEKIDAVRARIVAGEDFAKVAAEASESASKANGGLIGPLSLDDLSDQVKQTIAPLKPGEVSPVVRTATGFQIIRLESSTPRDIKPFDQARNQVGDKVYQTKQNNELRKYVETLRAQSIIEWKNEELQKAYDAGLKKVNAESGAPDAPPKLPSQ
jgi:peptidyl-prolyl cis-trans isomerase SurA